MGKRWTIETVAAQLDDPNWATLRRLLWLDSTLMQDLVREQFEDNDPAVMSLSQSMILRCVDAQGSGLTELVKRAGISKQAVGKTVRELEKLGYVSVSRSDRDARSRVVRFTQKGSALVRRIAEIENRVTQSLSATSIGKDLARLTDELKTLARVLLTEV